MLLKDLVNKSRVCFHDRFNNWEDAVRASCEPLIQDGSITTEYVDAVIGCVKKYGPYIVLTPHVAMPHSQEKAAGVNHTAISFMKVKEPVIFEEGNPDKNAEVFFAFVLNLVLVAFRKYTKIRAVYLTGNAMIVQAGISTYIVWKFLGTGMLPTIIIAAAITALYWGICSTLLIKPTHQITGGDFTVAHQQMVTSFLAYKIAPKIGNPEDDIEKKKMPSTLNFLQDSIVATALVMLLSVIVIFFLVGEEQINWLRMEAYKQASYKNNIVFALWIAFTLTANIVVLLYGVRMFVGELMMSFKGISEKLLPGAVAGVDCAAIFGFAPKSVVLGLLFGTLGQVLGLLGLLAFKSPIFLIPGFIPLFFDNATVSIFANKFGGWKAAAILCTINGLIQIAGSAIAVQLLNLTWWQGSADYATLWVAIIAIFKGIGSMLGIPVGV